MRKREILVCLVQQILCATVVPWIILGVTLLQSSSVMLQVFMSCWSLNVLFLNPCIRSFNAGFIESILASSVQPFVLGWCIVILVTV